MSDDHYDVVIAGAGLVGLALAPALARAGLSVALLDRAALSTPPESDAAFDQRIYAISPGSAAFLHALGAWQRLPLDRITAVDSMQVTGDAGATLSFSAQELGERALAWIVEERALRAALFPLARQSGVELITGTPFAALSFAADRGSLSLLEENARQRVVSGRLIVAADGARSWVREAAGVIASPRSYDQVAIVANFNCTRAHHGVARQWFGPQGDVLAWLPLPGRQISIVWSVPTAEAESLMALDDTAFAARVAKAGESALGTLTLQSATPLAARATFPLSLLKLPTPIAHRLALVGDAAHGVHPLAGQGVNLGFGDVEALAAVLADRAPLADPGAPILLERYARRRREPVLAMQTVTDGLARLFAPGLPWLRTLRNVGLTAVDRVPAVKRALAQPALR